MKTEYKAVIASVMVLALCLCAVGGVTYSWFSDTEQADVSITAGTIDLAMGNESISIQSYGGTEKPLSSGVSTSTDLGGTVTYTKDETQSTTKFMITFTNAAPGDKVIVKIPTFGITNTVNAAYIETYSIGAPSGVTNPFKITGIEDTARQISAPGNENQQTYDRSSDITIEVDSAMGTEIMGKAFTITLKFSAYQSNMPNPPSSAVNTIASGTVSSGSLNLNVATSDGKGATISIENQTSLSDIIVTAETTTNDDSAYTLGADVEVLGGVKVTAKDTSGNKDLSGIPVNVSISVPGDYTGSTLIIYHGEEVFTAVTVNSTDVNNGVTTINFTTTEGFSPYFLAKTKDNAIIATTGGTGYETLTGAIAAVKDGGTVILMQDSAGDGIGLYANPNSSKGQIMTKSFTLDLNGYTYVVTGGAQGSSGTENQAIHLEKPTNGNVDIVIKNGKVTTNDASELLRVIQNYTNLTLDNVVVDGTRLNQGVTDDVRYVVSNNCGDSVFKNGTEIITSGNDIAFDVYHWAYSDGSITPYANLGVSVTIDESFRTSGKVEIAQGSGDLSNWTGGFLARLILPDGNVIDYATDVHLIYSSDDLDFLIVTGSNGKTWYQVSNDMSFVFMDNITADGIKTEANVTFYLNGHTYNIDGTVGSSGTETNGFQLLSNGQPNYTAYDVAFVNGVVKSSKASIMIQNYSNLTLDNVIADGTNLQNGNPPGCYTVSNNNGNIVFKNGTKIIAKSDGSTTKHYAFDVCGYSVYPAVSVTIADASVIIEGNIEISASANHTGTYKLIGLNDSNSDGTPDEFSEFGVYVASNGIITKVTTTSV